MFCSRDRFSQRICYIQVRMYFTNIYRLHFEHFSRMELKRRLIC
eukprot:UN00586